VRRRRSSAASQLNAYEVELRVGEGLAVRALETPTWSVTCMTSISHFSVANGQPLQPLSNQPTQTDRNDGPGGGRRTGWPLREAA
jgi:hypothetical protein